MKRSCSLRDKIPHHSGSKFYIGRLHVQNDYLRNGKNILWKTFNISICFENSFHEYLIITVVVVTAVSVVRHIGELFPGASGKWCEKRIKKRQQTIQNDGQSETDAGYWVICLEKESWLEVDLRCNPQWWRTNGSNSKSCRQITNLILCQINHWRLGRKEIHQV